MYSLETKSTARIKHLKEHQTTAEPDRNIIRVYRFNPEGIMFQVWRGRTSVSVYLTDDEAAKLGNQLLATASAPGFHEAVQS